MFRTGQLSAVKELISTGVNFPERLDLAKMLKMFLRSFDDGDCWQSISAPGEGVGTLDLVAEPFGELKLYSLKDMWLTA